MKLKVRKIADLRREAKQVEALHVALSLKQSEWGLRPAARLLGVGVGEMQRLLDRYGLRAEYDKHPRAKGGRTPKK